VEHNLGERKDLSDWHLGTPVEYAKTSLLGWINELINRLKIKQSKISDKEETEESSLLSESPLRARGCEQEQQ
jgi:hypothetical protein